MGINIKEKFSFITAEDLKEGDIIAEIPLNYREFRRLHKSKITHIKVEIFNVLLKLHNLDKDVHFNRRTTCSKLFLKF